MLEDLAPSLPASATASERPAPSGAPVSPDPVATADGPVADPGGSLLWVDRSAEAERVLSFISAAAGRLIVLYGKRGIGKTELICRWVLPRLGDGGGSYTDVQTALLGKGDRGGQVDRLSAAMRSGAVVFVDSAEELLDADAAERNLFLHRAMALAKRLVLVVNEERLRDVFALRSQFPEILDHTLEIAGVDLRCGLATLLPSGAASGSAEGNLAAALLGRAAEENLGVLAGKSGGVSPGLLRIVDSRLRRSPAAADAAGAATAVAEHSGDRRPPGLDSLLWDYARDRLEAIPAGALPPKTRFELGLAIVEEVAAFGKAAAPIQLQDIALRVGAGIDECRRVLAHLQGTDGLIRELEEGRYALVPPELAKVVTAEGSRRRANAWESEHLIDQAVAAWRGENALLPRRAFREVQKHRRSLRLQPEEINLLVRSALLHDDEPELPAARYWLQRLANPQAATDILLSSLFHPTEKVRSRASTLLGELPEPAVRDQLHSLALRDPDPGVRQCAASSLARMKTEELRGLLAAEVRAERSPYRREALATLRIFDDAATVEIIRSLLDGGVLGPGLRRTAIQVLTWRQRCRYGLAAWRFRFGVWPRLALTCLVLGVPLVVVLGSEGYLTLTEPFSPQLRIVESHPKSASEEIRRLRTAEFLASVYPHESYARLAALFRNQQESAESRAGLAKSLSFIILRGDDPEREAARTALIRASQRAENPALRKAALTNIASTLRDRSDAATSKALLPVLSVILGDERDDMALRRLALAGLAAMGSPEASAALSRFAASRPPPPPGPAGTSDMDLRREEDIRLESVTALWRMGIPDAITELCNLAAAPLAAALREAARQASTDPLWRIRDDLAHGKPDHAAKLAGQFVAASTAGLAPAAEVFALLGKAHYQMASGALGGQGHEDWRSARDSLLKAERAGSQDRDVPRLLALVEELDQSSYRRELLPPIRNSR